jgi:dihydrolipoamide dehydrogenase
MTNPDILIIGAGPGGYVAAIRAAQLGKKVLIVDHDLIGGVCLNQGCIPTKALLHYTEILAEANNVSRAGIKFSKPEIDFKIFNQQIQNITTRLRKGIEFLFRNYEIEYLPAKASFINNTDVSLKLSDQTEQIITPNIIVIATGSKQAIIPGLESDQKNIITSDEALIINQVPSNLMIVGAGAIGLEFATIYQRLGSKITIVEIMDQILPGTDTETAKHLMNIMKKRGIDIKLKTKVLKITQDNSIKVFLQTENQEFVTNTDKILVSAGRIPNTENLGLENTDIQLTDKKFIKVNENYETTQKNIYAIGDVIGQPLLAHKAMAQGIFIAEKIAGQKDTNNPKVIPNCIYTEPELASVGLSEEQAKLMNYDIIISRFPLSAIGRAHTLGQIDGSIKVIADKKTDQILGFHILAPDASILINEITLAMNSGLKLTSIINTIHPHPTLSEAIQEACAAVYKKAIHIKQ